jgi:hypothetical protein
LKWNLVDKDFIKVAKEMGFKIEAPATISVRKKNFVPLGNQRIHIARWVFEDDSKVGTVKRL